MHVMQASQAEIKYSLQSTPKHVTKNVTKHATKHVNM